MSFVERLPTLLRELSEPTTAYSASELWCRIQGAGWELCIPVLLSELRGDNSDVKRLVLAILSQEAEQIGTESTEPFHRAVEQLLSDEDRLVRVAAIHAVRDLNLSSASQALRHIACNDKVELSRQALVTLIELDDGVVEELVQMLRQESS